MVHLTVDRGEDCVDAEHCYCKAKLQEAMLSLEAAHYYGYTYFVLSTQIIPNGLLNIYVSRILAFTH